MQKSLQRAWQASLSYSFIHQIFLNHLGPASNLKFHLFSTTRFSSHTQSDQIFLVSSFHASEVKIPQISLSNCLVLESLQNLLLDVLPAARQQAKRKRPWKMECLSLNNLSSEYKHITPVQSVLARTSYMVSLRCKGSLGK